MRVIKYFAVLLFCLLLPGASWAQQLYVSDVQDISLRSAPNLDSKPVMMIKSGDKLSKIREEGEWAYVHTDSGKEGWVLKRFLSSDTPIKIKFDEFKSKNAEMLEKSGQIGAIVGKYEDEIKNLQKNLTSAQSDNAKLKRDLDTFSHANSNVTELVKKHEELNNDFEALKQNTEKYKRENETLRDLSDVKWFLAGAGVFFGGGMLGYLLGHSSRKKSNRMY